MRWSSGILDCLLSCQLESDVVTIVARVKCKIKFTSSFTDSDSPIRVGCSIADGDSKLCRCQSICQPRKRLNCVEIDDGQWEMVQVVAEYRVLDDEWTDSCPRRSKVDESKASGKFRVNGADNEFEFDYFFNKMWLRMHVLLGAMIVQVEDGYECERALWLATSHQMFNGTVFHFISDDGWCDCRQIHIVRCAPVRSHFTRKLREIMHFLCRTSIIH